MSIYDHDEQDLILLGLKLPYWILPPDPFQEAFDVEIPPMSTYDLAAVLEGGCESGAWMPAVTYYTATQIMSKFGDDVLQYLDDAGLDMNVDGKDMSWVGIACHFLSMAVECWCAEHEQLVQEALLKQREGQTK